MKSNYNKIGQYIRLVDERNFDLKVETLLGLTINKDFIPSVANTVGSDMSRYKIIRKNQFACSLMQVRRDKKIPVALQRNYKEAIISQAYPVFDVTNKDELLPEYLMMWFSRSEFDREACFYAVGGVRGSLEWEDFCNMQLPVPDIEKQKSIVKEHNTIVNRIKLNEQLNQKLEETAQAIYKQWFVDFEFPDENGKPYKSGGGEMEFNEELDKEIPKGWKVVPIKEFVSEMKSGGTPNREMHEYWNSKDIPWLKTGELNNKIILEAEEYISFSGCKNSSAKKLPINAVLIAMYGQGDTKGKVGLLKFEATTNQACCAMICDNIKLSSYLYYFFRINRNEIVSIAIGGAQPNLSKAIIEELQILKPKYELFEKHHFEEIINYREKIEIENMILCKIENMILSKMTKA